MSAQLAVQRRVLPPVPTSVAQARAFATGAADRWGVSQEHLHTIQLLVSELVTNAILHAGGATDVELKLQMSTGIVRIEVCDNQGLLRPRLRHSEPLDAGGRGLELVAALSSRWGVDVQSDDRKVVWAELSYED